MTILSNPKHEAVAQAFIADASKVGWRAYKAVYPRASQRAAETQFSRLLKNVEFAGRIAEMQAQAAEGAVLSARQVLEGLSRLASSNMKDYMRVGPDGDPVLDFGNLTDDQAAALCEVTVETFMVGAGKDAREVRRVKFKLADKLGPLVALGRHHKLFTDKHEHTGKEGKPIEHAIVTDRDRARALAAFVAKTKAKAKDPVATEH
jgi:phage terminase small subunit